MNKWCIVGLGFIAQRHIDAIKDIGDELILACDIDVTKAQKVPGIPFITDYRKLPEHHLWEQVNWVAVCTPNCLHYDMIQFARRRGKRVLCEKPLVIREEHLRDLDEDVYTVLQLRHNEEIKELKNEIDEVLSENRQVMYHGQLTMCVHRDDFYFEGWKGDKNKSGDLLYNIGIHYIDLLCYLFDKSNATLFITKQSEKSIQGVFNIRYIANITWKISIDAPKDNQIRQLRIGEKVISLDRNFENLHMKVYEQTVLGKGVTAKEAGRAIKLIQHAVHCG